MALRRKYWDADPEGLMTCLQTLRTYLNNLANSPHEQKRGPQINTQLPASTTLLRSDLHRMHPSTMSSPTY
eukprot:1080021-Amphidinium_carterae.1